MRVEEERFEERFYAETTNVGGLVLYLPCHHQTRPRRRLVVEYSGFSLFSISKSTDHGLFTRLVAIHVHFTSSINVLLDVYVMNGLQVSSWDLEPTQQNIALLQQVVKDLETVHNPQTINTRRLQSQSVFTSTSTS
jgi:hypothetical protein